MITKQLFYYLSIILIGISFFSCGYSNLVKGIIDDNLSLVSQEISAGANINSSDGTIPLNLALRIGRWDIAKYLVENGADVNAKSGNGITPLMIASAWGNLELVELLLEKVADVNDIDNNGLSVLMHACSPKTKISCLDLLVNKGADINRKFKIEGNEKFEKDLNIMAAMEYRQDIVNFFKDKGLSTNTDKPIICIGYGQTNKGQNAIEYDIRFSGIVFENINFNGYKGKLPTRLSILGLDDKKFEEGITYAEVSIGNHKITAKYYWSEGFAHSGGRTTVESQPIEVSINCESKSVYVLHPVISQSRCEIRVFRIVL